MTSEWSTVGAVEVNGVRLGCRQAGDPAGAPLLLLHGSGSSAGARDRFAARLTPAGHRAIAVDLRGHATSARRGGRDYQLRAVGSILRQLSRPDPDWWGRLGEVRQPTLILSGGPASCIPPQRLAEVRAAIPGARLATIPVGHRAHSLAPERFAAEVLAFLAEPTVGATRRAESSVPG